MGLTGRLPTESCLLIGCLLLDMAYSVPIYTDPNNPYIDPYPYPYDPYPTHLYRKTHLHLPQTRVSEKIHLSQKTHAHKSHLTQRTRLSQKIYYRDSAPDDVYLRRKRQSNQDFTRDIKDLLTGTDFGSFPKGPSDFFKDSGTSDFFKNSGTSNFFKDNTASNLFKESGTSDFFKDGTASNFFKANSGTSDFFKESGASNFFKDNSGASDVFKDSTASNFFKDNSGASNFFKVNSEPSNFFKDNSGAPNLFKEIGTSNFFKNSGNSDFFKSGFGSLTKDSPDLSTPSKLFSSLASAPRGSPGKDGTTEPPKNGVPSSGSGAGGGSVITVPQRPKEPPSNCPPGFKWFYNKCYEIYDFSAQR
ncbi:hypothetical protein M8J76_000522 [Diaphorina citri]|nr:hypothetical protein M8J75_010669 [Diaphorina citri]KAI5716070.1 hypothetical protein M8J76_000522 [Diaphorina citri]